MLVQENELLTVPMVMARLKVGRTRVYELLNSGALRGVKLGASRRILATDLAAYLQSLVEE